MGLRIGLFVIAALLLGAHFLRAGNFAMVALCLAALQFLAYGAAVAWIAVAIQLVQTRQQLGQPWTMAAIILGSVASFTLLAGLLLNSRAITERYPGRSDPAWHRAGNPPAERPKPRA